MRFHGVRRTRVLAALAFLALVFLLWRAARLYVGQTLENLAPTLVARLEKRLGREVRLNRLSVDQPGLIVAEGVRVSRGRTFAAGELLTAERVEVTYNPALLAWSTLVSRGLGLDTRATVRAAGVRVSQPAPLPARELGYAEWVRARFDLAPILQGKGDLLATVDDVELSRLRTQIARDARGRWSFDPLLKLQPKRKPSSFRGTIRLAAAVVDLADYRSGALPAPARNRLAGSGTVSFAAYPTVRFAAEGRVPGAHGGRLRVQGHRQIRAKRWFVTMEADTQSVPYWFRYFASGVKGTRILAGRGTVTGTLSTVPGSNTLTYRLSARVQGAAAQVPVLTAPVRDYAGQLALEPGVLEFDGTATAAGIPLRGRGHFVWGAGGRSKLSLSSDRVTAQALARLHPSLVLPAELKVPGLLRVSSLSIEGSARRWRFRGQVTTPALEYGEARVQAPVTWLEAQLADGRLSSVSGTLTAPAGRFRDTPARNATADFLWKGQLLQSRTRFQALGAQVAATAWIDAQPEDPRLYATGFAHGVDLAQLPLPEGRQRPGGMATLDFVLGGTLARPEVSAYVQARELQWAGERIEQVSGRVKYAGGIWTLHQGTVSDPRLTGSLAGTVSSDGALDLRLQARGVDLRQALQGRVAAAPSGTAFLSAAVGGTLDKPTVSGFAQVYQPSYGGRQADYAEAAFQAGDADRVQLSGVKLLRQPAQLTAERLVLTRGEGEGAAWGVEGEATATGLTIPAVLRLAGLTQERLQEVPVAGSLEPVRLQVAGPLSGPTVRFAAASPDTLVAGLDLGRVEARGEFEAAARRLRLDAVEAMSPRGRFAASGAVVLPEPVAGKDARPAAAMDLGFSVSGIRLLPLARQFAPELLEQVQFSGKLAEATGRVTGSTDAPELSARLALEEVLVNGRAVPVEPFSISWTPGAVLVRDLTAQLGSGAVQAPYLGLLLDRKGRLADRVAGQVAIERVPVGVARQLLEDSRFYATDRARPLREALAEWTAPVSGRISARAEAGTGPPPASVSELVHAISTRNGPGRLEGTLRIEDLVSPPGPGRAPVRVDGRFSYMGGRFEVPQLLLRQDGGASLVLSGARGVPARDGAGRLDFNLKVSAFELETLARLPIPRLRERLDALRPLAGRVELTASIGGTEQQPTARFTLEVAEPVLRGLAFERLVVTGGDYSAARGELRVGSARLSKTVPGAGEQPAGLVVSGFVPVRWPELEMPRQAPRSLRVEIPEQSLAVFQVLANDARLDTAEEAGATPRAAETRFLTGIFRSIAAAGGQMRGEMLLAGTAAAPNNSGYFALNDATLRLEGLDTAIEDLDGRLELVGNTARLTEFRGRGSQGGTLTAGGEVLLGGGTAGRPRLALTLALDRFRFVEKQVARLLKGSFGVTQVRGTLDTVQAGEGARQAPLTIAGEWPSPVITGGIRLQEASVVMPFGDWGRRGGAPVPFNPAFNVRLIVGDDVWIRNPQLRLRLAGSLQAGGTLAQPVLAGNLQADRGSFTLTTVRLRDVGGVIRVNYDGRQQELGLPVNPPVFVDLTGATSIRVQRAAADEAEYYDATFAIRGSPTGAGGSGFRTTGVGVAVGSGEGLTLTIRTDPPLPSQQIEALIRQQLGVEGFGGGGSNVVEALRGQIEQAFAVNVGSALTGPIEEKLESALGLSLLSIDVGISQPLRLRLGRRLFGHSYGTITQEFGGVEDQSRFEFYYRISPQFRIGYRNEQPTKRDVFFFSGTLSF